MYPPLPISAYDGAVPARSAPSMMRKRSAADARLIERLRKICMALPEAVEKLSHGEPTWFAGKGRVFAMLDDHHHGAAHLSVWLPQPLGAQEGLVEADAERFFRPPYVGPSGWIGVVLDTKPDWAMVTAMVREAYLLVAAPMLGAAPRAKSTARWPPARSTAKSRSHMAKRTR